MSVSRVRGGIGALALLMVLMLASTSRAAELLGTFEASDHRFRLVKLADGLEHPWSLAFLPDGRMLVTERPGRLRIVADGRVLPEPVPGVPEVRASGQGGLLDVVLHPDFAANRLVYFTYAGPGSGGAATAVARGRFEDGRIAGLEVLYEALPRASGGRHFGSRLVFSGDGHIFVTAGERGDADRAQDLGDPAGSVIRLHEDGRVPDDNPFVGTPGARPEIYSWGNRNPQGLARDPATGVLWEIEHGPRGGDELNRIEAGANYGWPVITYGRSYAGFKIGEGTHKDGMAQPVHYWVPSISPSGLAVYDGDRFPAWKGNLFLGALSGTLLARLIMVDGRVVGEERLLEDLDERIRDVRQGPDGLIYLLTDHPDGMLLRLEPAD